MKLQRISILLAFLSFIASGMAQDGKSKTPTLEALPETVSHQRQLSISGKTISYQVTAGYLTLKEEDGTPRANIFYTAYHRTDIKDITKRPITFSFNGGPGSSSVWLHLGVLGPKRVLMSDTGESLAPPYQLVDNEYSWLDLTDLVFIDPVSTGFSRAAGSAKATDFHGYSKDIASVGDFVRRYVTENQRWASPKYLIGESYGTTRASGLSEHLVDKYGMYLNGVILVSAVTEFSTIRFSESNDLPYAAFLPGYAAVAHYHKQLPPQQQQKDIAVFVDELRTFVNKEYVPALFMGQQLSKEERYSLAQKLSSYTGIDTTYLLRTDLRVYAQHFMKELLRGEQLVVGRFDGRYTALELDGNDESPDLDPSYQPAVLGCFSTCLNDYLSRDLGFKTHLPYEVLTPKVHPWDYDNAKGKYLSVTHNLRNAMTKNRHLQVWVLNGYYDLATPFFGTEYSFNHAGFDARLKKNISMTYYQAGHMMYLHKPSLVKMRQDALLFFGVGE